MGKRRNNTPCPRCGMPVSWFERNRVGDRTYVYAVHYSKKSKHKCYLGPEDGYVLVTMMHKKEGLVLKGLNDPDRVLEYFERILRLILSNERLKEEVWKRYSHLIKQLSP